MQGPDIEPLITEAVQRVHHDLQRAVAELETQAVEARRRAAVVVAYVDELEAYESAEARYRLDHRAWVQRGALGPEPRLFADRPVLPGPWVGR